MKIAIAENPSIWNHPSRLSLKVIDVCNKNNIDYGIIDPYAYDVIDQLSHYDALVWGFQNYLHADLMEARSILHVAEKMGLKVYPDINTAWHFDDKIAETYALQGVGAPIPQSYMFYSQAEACRFFDSYTDYPIVAKLRCGSGASNVRLIHNAAEGHKYAATMFGPGLDPSPSLRYKAFSKLQSSHNFSTLVKRIKKIPVFLRTRRAAKEMPRECGYVFLQEFIPNNGYDIKVAVVGEKLLFFTRAVRKGDFRASGGGEISYRHNLLTPQIIESAFSTADKLGAQCMGFDYVVDSATGQGKIIEMCYGFDFDLAVGGGGYYTRNGEWVEASINVAEEIINNLVNSGK